jgi:hypothetical protein
MPYTVLGAFDKFRTENVDLVTAQARDGRASRDFLFDNIKTLPGKYPWFPRLIGSYLSYGSFVRSTKIRPLDDIDVLILLTGTGTELVRHSNDPNVLWLRIVDRSSPLARFPDAFGFVNSTKVLDAFKAALADVPAYAQAEIKRSGEAITLSLKSYPWVFDVVPAVPVNGDGGRLAYYLIPNGAGDWMATDPRRDSTRMTDSNQCHAGQLLPVVRLLKYWNRRTHKPRLPSYYFETLVTNTFYLTPPINNTPQARHRFFSSGTTALWLTCDDPKGLGPALDADVDGATKLKVDAAMEEAATFASYALSYEARDDHANAMYWWRRVLGTDFPEYG